MERRVVFKNMNSDRSLFLILWTVFAGFLIAFTAGWMPHFSDVFRASSFHTLSDFIVFWSIVIAPYPLMFFLPRLRKKRRKTAGDPHCGHLTLMRHIRL